VYALYFLYLYASRCYGLRLSVLNKETTYLLTYIYLDQNNLLFIRTIQRTYLYLHQ